MTETSSPTGTPAADPLAAGRAAYERHEWRDAFDRLGEADRTGSLGGADLEALATAAFFSAEAAAGNEAKERAFRAYVAEGNAVRAAYLALDIAHEHGLRGPPLDGLRLAAQGRAAARRAAGVVCPRVRRPAPERGGDGRRPGARPDPRPGGDRHRQPGGRRGPARVRADEPRLPQDRRRGHRVRVRADGGGVDRGDQRRAVAGRQRDHLLPDDLGLPGPHGLPARRRSGSTPPSPTASARRCPGSRACVASIEPRCGRSAARGTRPSRS